MKHWKNILFIITTFVLALASCSKDDIHGDGFHHPAQKGPEESSRISTEEKRNVLLLYSAGYNSLSDYLIEDINDLQQGWLPGSGRNDNILLVYSHLPVKKNAYSTDTSPTLTRIYSDHNGQTVRDTLEKYPSGTRSATSEQLNKVLNDVKQAFPAKSYGMIFSSHATGYLPAGYYTNPRDYFYHEKSGISYRIGGGSDVACPVPYTAPEHDPSLPEVKSIGQDQVGGYGSYVSYEIELDDFAKALPMQIEYILFDACLMGGIEVAYELKDKCHYVGFSQTEVLAEGFDYKSLAEHLLGSDTPDPQAVCEDYFQQYDIQSGVYRSATISMIDCTRLEPIADVCRGLFEKYRTQMALVNPETIQRFYRSDYHWFYDMVDIVARSGATEDEIQAMNEALDQCVVYKAATPEFMGAFPIDTFSGLSMYFPYTKLDGSIPELTLQMYYKTLKWNIATGLVK